MYNIEIKICNKNGWFTPQEARNYYGRYSRDGITWHWWGLPELNPDSAHDNIVNYIAGKANAGTGSVNYVLSNSKITLMVNPDDVAFASQGGNPVSVSVELSSNLNAEGYKKAGWLAWQLEGRYGKGLANYPHNKWFSTQCPGTISLDRIQQEKTKWATGQYNAAPTPPVDTRPEWKKNLQPINPTITKWAVDDTTPLRNLEATANVITNLKKGTPVEIAGKTQIGSYPYYLTKSAMDDGRAAGFDFYELQDTDPNAPAPDLRPEWERNLNNVAPVTMYTLNNAKLVDVNTLAISKPFALDTPMEIVAETTVNSLQFWITKSSYDGKRPTGFLKGDLKSEVTPPTPVEPVQPEWVKRTHDIDDTKMWLKRDVLLTDITTGQPAKDAKGNTTLLKKDSEFTVSALTFVGTKEYRLTDYSFKKGVYNGVLIDDLTLTAPGLPDVPPVPQNPDMIDKNVVIVFIMSIIKLLTDFANKLKEKKD